jgi:hypothetical protein
MEGPRARGGETRPCGKCHGPVLKALLPVVPSFTHPRSPNVGRGFFATKASCRRLEIALQWYLLATGPVPTAPRGQCFSAALVVPKPIPARAALFWRVTRLLQKAKFLKAKSGTATRPTGCYCCQWRDNGTKRISFFRRPSMHPVRREDAIGSR